MSCSAVPSSRWHTLPHFVLEYRAYVMDIERRRFGTDIDGFWQDTQLGMFSGWPVLGSVHLYNSVIGHLDTLHNEEAFLRIIIEKYITMLNSTSSYDCDACCEVMKSFGRRLISERGYEVALSVLIGALRCLPPVAIRNVILETIPSLYSLMWHDTHERALLAALCGCVDVAAVALDNDVNAPIMNVHEGHIYYTPTLLHVAACMGDVTMTKSLINGGADINSKGFAADALDVCIRISSYHHVIRAKGIHLLN